MVALEGVRGVRGPGGDGLRPRLRDAEEVFYLGLALDEGYVEGFVEGCLKRGREVVFGRLHSRLPL